MSELLHHSRRAWCTNAEAACMQALQRVRPYIAQSTEAEQQQQLVSSKNAAAPEAKLEQDMAPSGAGIGAKAADTTDLAAADGDKGDAPAVNDIDVNCHMLTTGILPKSSVK